MQSLILKLQEDVAARKRPRTEFRPLARSAVLVAVLGGLAYSLGARSPDDPTSWARTTARDRLLALNAEVEGLQGTLELQRAQLERLERAYALSARYGIGADLAMTIEDVALAESVDPALAFELVRLESNFNPRAVSPAGALGLTQLMPATAQWLSPEITRAEIFEPETNLRLGFRFYRSLLDYYKGDVRLALLAYNRGPITVDRLLREGVDPGNGYARVIMSRRAANTLR